MSRVWVERRGGRAPSSGDVAVPRSPFALVCRLLDDPLVWALGVLLVALWCIGQVVVGEPATPIESLPPAVYVVEAGP